MGRNQYGCEIPRAEDRRLTITGVASTDARELGIEGLCSLAIGELKTRARRGRGRARGARGHSRRIRHRARGRNSGRTTRRSRRSRRTIARQTTRRTGGCNPGRRILLCVTRQAGSRFVYERESEALSRSGAGNYLPGATGALSESTADAGGISV